jgi:signal transduction histidine kinase/tetratricopeptide (TPR) repeat protein
MYNNQTMSKSQLVKRCLIVFIFVIIGFFQGFSQSSEDINSLIENLLKKDFRQIQVHVADTILTKTLLIKAKRCAENRNDSALIYAFQFIISAEKAGMVSGISEALEMLGEYSMTKENFSDAINRYIQALKLEEKLGNQSRIADLYDLLGAVYYYQEIFPKSLEYNQKALSIYQNLNDTIKIAKALSHLGSLHLSREYCEKRTPDQIKADQETALEYYLQSLNLLENENFKEGIVNAWSNIGNLYRRMGDLDQALVYVQKAVVYYRETKNKNRLPATLRMLGLIYNKQMKYDQALACMLESKEIGEQQKLTDGIQFLYEDVAQTYENLSDFRNSLKYYKKYMTLRDSVYNSEKSNQIFELETKYQAEKKQAEIEKLTLIKQQSRLLISILVVTLLLVSLLGYTYFRNISSKKIIADQQLEIKEKQLLELEKERQLSAAKSVLQGEEAERSRLAGDLHDGLGGLLTGVKLKLSSMKENSIITSENLAHFNHALDLLDTSITEMRRVAHNLMPETLMHYGLRTALGDFIKQVEPEGLPIIRSSNFGTDLRYEKEIEITIYRITQELVTNAIKHSNAKQIDIQLFTELDRICVQVNDNGIGFDPQGPDHIKAGKGLKNIHDRVTAFNGRFELISQTGKGTECTIEFLIS